MVLYRLTAAQIQYRMNEALWLANGLSNHTWLVSFSTDSSSAVSAALLRILSASLSGDVFRVSPQEAVCVGGKHTFFCVFFLETATFNKSWCQTLNAELHTVVMVQMLRMTQPFPDFTITWFFVYFLGGFFPGNMQHNTWSSTVACWAGVDVYDHRWNGDVTTSRPSKIQRVKTWSM